MGDPPRFDIVIPTLGRPWLASLLQALGAGSGPLPQHLYLVDDRRDRSTPLLQVNIPEKLVDRLMILQGGPIRGPAAARNIGWQTASAPWVVFLDDDVVPEPDWLTRLTCDLTGLSSMVAASQGRVRVPLPDGRRPTDWERNVQGLENARWITADIAYRREVLSEVGGFDERFRRAYREDVDLGLRVVQAGYRIGWGQRCVVHVVRPADPLISVRLQAGNADDVLMRALHGARWREAVGGDGRGRRPRHILITMAGVIGLVGFLNRRRWMAIAGSTGWLIGTAELAWARISPGPRTPTEVAKMLVTSALIPTVATLHWLHGLARRRRLLADTHRPPHRNPGAHARGAAVRYRPSRSGEDGAHI
jgi:hypothetical protein